MRPTWLRSPRCDPGRHRSNHQTLLQVTHSVPIVFAQAIDPVGSNFVDTLARPGGNATGFMQFEFDLAGKWLELLKEIAPQVKRVGVLRSPGPTIGSTGQWAVIQAFSRSAEVELSRIDLRSTDEIKRAITVFRARRTAA